VLQPPTYAITVNDTSPVFFYCSAPGSCITYGMVGAINPNINTSISAQQQSAKGSTYMLNPGEPFPPESPLSSTTPSAASTPTVSKTHGLSAGAIAGIVVGTVTLGVFIALITFLCRRRPEKKTEQGTNQGQFDTYNAPKDNTAPPYHALSPCAMSPSSFGTWPGSPQQPQELWAKP
jgi:hypothetical protein